VDDDLDRSPSEHERPTFNAANRSIVPLRLESMRSDEREYSGIAAVLEHGDEAQVVAALLLALLEDGQCVALDQ
jgi:hypothetical protein